MSHDGRTDDVLLRWDEEFSRGNDIPVDELCRECPELAGAVGAEIAKLKRMHRFLEPAAPKEKTTARLMLDGSRYRVVCFHARGALGEVYLARDQEVGRDVALKVMQAHLTQHEDSRQRFVREAEITGRLEHPGIVPIYGLGEDSVKQPFYAMRFIRGESLRDAIATFHKANQGGRNRDKRQHDLRELVSRLIAVCNAAAYAHSRGIVHRDIKPANVMLGYFGETLLVDWGLARPFERTPEERAAGEETLRPISGVGDTTQLGSAAGTPAYMSPEQANGLWTRVGPASDIFSLGAALGHIVTGTTPYEGKKALDHARNGEFMAPRQRDRRVPKALEAICLKAMALAPQQRYDNAKSMATDLERWLADEPVNAYSEPIWERGRRWVRKHRGLVTSSVAGLLVAVLLLGGATAMLTAAYEKQTELRFAAEAAQVEETKQRHAAEKAERDAKEERDKAEKARERADKFKTTLIDVFESTNRQRRGANLKVVDLLDSATDTINKEYVDDPSLRHKLLFPIGLAYADTAPKKAIQMLEEVFIVIKQHKDPDDPSRLKTAKALGWAYYVTGNYQKSELALREWVSVMEPRAAGQDVDVAYQVSLLGECQLFNRKFPDAEANLKTGLAIYDAKAPENYFRFDTQGLLAEALMGQQKYDDAEPLVKSSYKALTTKTTPPPHSTLLYRAMKRTLKLYRLWEKNDQLAYWRNEVAEAAQAHYTKREFFEAERLYLQWYKSSSPKLNDNPRLVALNLNLLGECQVRQAKFKEAEPYLRESLKLYIKVAPQDVVRYDTESLLGASLAGQKNFVEAEGYARDGYYGLEKLGNKGLLRDALDRLIDLYQDWGKKDEAMNWHAIRDGKGAGKRPVPDELPRGKGKLQSTREALRQDAGEPTLRALCGEPALTHGAPVWVAGSTQDASPG